MTNIIIATTTINPPTKALLRHIEIHDHKIVIAGDLKTPHHLYENLKNVIYLHPDYQQEKYKELSEVLGWNKIERRNIAVLEAYNRGAEIIALVDDDNIPNDDWSQNVSLNNETEVNFFSTDLPAFDPIYHTNHPEFWQRGYPLEIVSERDKFVLSKKLIKPMAQIDLWDGEPDIDAIIRMIYKPSIKLESNYFPYSSNALIPFNSQNTFLHRDSVKDYFLFPDVGRNHDIFAAYYYSACGHEIVVKKPSVVSDRSIGTAGRYSYMHDVKAEYYSVEKVMDLTKDLKKDPNLIEKYISDNAKKAFYIWKKAFNNNLM